MKVLIILFSNLKLPGAFLSGANCCDVSFQNSDLSGANFKFANLSKAKFEGANMTDVVVENRY